MITVPDSVNGSVPRRPLALMLPEDPSPEELAQYWTLSPQDKHEVCKCRGEAQRRRFAVQLCMLRTCGRFLPKAVPAPTAITNHLARQLDLPLVLFGDVPGRLATETDHFHHIRTYLGWQPFDDTSPGRLITWLNQRATDDLLPSILVSRAEDILRAWKIVVPARSTLDELVGKRNKKVAIKHGFEGAWERILLWHGWRVVRIGFTSWRTVPPLFLLCLALISALDRDAQQPFCYASCRSCGAHTLQSGTACGHKMGRRGHRHPEQGGPLHIVAPRAAVDITLGAGPWVPHSAADVRPDT